MKSRILVAAALCITAFAAAAGAASAVRPSDFGGSGAGTPLVSWSATAGGSTLHFNAVTSNNCNTYGCVKYNFPGNSSQWAGKPSGLSSDCFNTCTRTVFSNAERGWNNQTVSTRNACAYYLLNYDIGGNHQAVPYGGGWTALPFTGVGSAAVFPQTGGWVC